KWGVDGEYINDRELLPARENRLPRPSLRPPGPLARRPALGRVDVRPSRPPPPSRPFETDVAGPSASRVARPADLPSARRAPLARLSGRKGVPPVLPGHASCIRSG